MTLAAKIKQLREERGWRPTYLSMELGCSLTTVYRLESETKYRPRLYMLYALAHVFGITYEELMKGVDID